MNFQTDMLIEGSIKIVNNIWMALLPELGETLFSTPGIMVMLLIAYGGAMWMFLSSAPKVYTIMVSDLNVAKEFYEDLLELPVAEVPLHYYYNYDQSLGVGALDPLYLGSGLNYNVPRHNEGLWYQLKRNTQIHVIGGASFGYKNCQRHVCFDRECLEAILLRVQSRRLKYKIRTEKPLNFLVKDWNNRVFEMAEAGG